MQRRGAFALVDILATLGVVALLCACAEQEGRQEATLRQQDQRAYERALPILPKYLVGG